MQENHVHLQSKVGNERHHSVRWVFIIAHKLSRQQRRKINRFLYCELGWQDNFGTKFQDYLNIMERLQEESQNFRVYLVVDLANYTTIFSQAMRKKYSHFLQSINSAYLFPFQKGQSFEVQRLKIQNKLIDRHFLNFQSFISQNEKQIQKNPLNKSLLSNFNILGLEKSQRKAKERRMKIYSCLTLEEKYYEEYFDKFVNVLNKQASMNLLNEYVQDELREAVQLLKNKKTKEFYNKMFALYKVQSRFYYVVNNSLKKFGDENFSWNSYALPISLLFKAIKLYFNDPENRKQMEKLFDKNGECILWRAAKFSGDQLKQIQKNRMSQNIFYEHISFTSTSLSKEVAVQFLDPLDLESCCLVKYKIKRPSFQKQVNKLDFVLFSFAHLFGKDSQNRQQLQVLLNSLTICVLKSTSVIKLSQIKNMNDKVYKKFESIYQKIDIPIIQMEIVGNFIQTYMPKENSIYAKQFPKPLKYYLGTIDIIKSTKIFDIGYAFEYSGHLKQAYTHFETLLQKQRQKKYKDQRQMYYLQNRLAQILQKMDNNQDALIHVRNAIQICKIIQKEEKNLDRKEHQLLLYKMIQKSGYLLQTNYFYHQAIREVTQYLHLLMQKATSQKLLRQAYLFQYAQYLIMRGMIHFRQGQVRKAKDDINQSHQMLLKILKEINYQQIKKQTFYIEFIIHFLIDEFVPWDTEQYFKKKRMENIVQATGVFGGEGKLLHVLQKSKGISNIISSFVEKRNRQLQRQRQQRQQRQRLLRLQIQKQKLLKVDISHLQQQLKKLNELNQVPEKVKIEQIQQQVKQHLVIKQIKPQVQQFFQYFNNIANNSNTFIQQNEQQMRQILLEIQTENVSLNGLLESQAKLIKLKEKINNHKIKDWKSIFTHDQNWLQLQFKFDELIHLKRSHNYKLLENMFNQVTRNNFRQYCQKNIATINQIKAKYQEEGYPLPQRFQFKLNSFQAKLQEGLGNQKEQMKIFNQIIDNTISDTNLKALNLISTYLLKIRLYFNQVEIDFEHLLLYRTHQKIAQTREWQKKKIKQCKYAMEEVKLQIEIFKQKNLWLKEEGQNKIKTIFTEKQIQTMLCMVRLAVFDLYFLKENTITCLRPTSLKPIKSKPIESKHIQQLFQSILHNIYCNIKQHDKRQQYLGQYHEINSFYFYILEEFELSFKNIEEGLAKLKCSNPVKQFKILTKLFFMFSDKKEMGLTSYASQLTHIYKHYQAYPSYWKVCLAYHFNYRFIKSTKKSVDKCVSILQKIHAQKIKLKLIQDCELKMYLSYLSVKNEQNTKVQNPERQGQKSSIIHLNSFYYQLQKRNREFYEQNVQIKLPHTQRRYQNKAYDFVKNQISLIRKPESQHETAYTVSMLSKISRRQSQ